MPRRLIIWSLVSLLVAVAADPLAALVARGATFAGFGGQVTRADLIKAGPSDDELATLPTSLREVTVAGTEIGDAGVAHLRLLTGLAAVHLPGTRITDVGMASLGGDA